MFDEQPCFARALICGLNCSRSKGMCEPPGSMAQSQSSLIAAAKRVRTENFRLRRRLAPATMPRMRFARPAHFFDGVVASRLHQQGRNRFARVWGCSAQRLRGSLLGISLPDQHVSGPFRRLFHQRCPGENLGGTLSSSSDFDSTPYVSLSFWVNGGPAGGQRLQVQGLLGKANPPADVYYRFTLAPGRVGTDHDSAGCPGCGPEDQLLGHLDSTDPGRQDRSLLCG